MSHVWHKLGDNPWGGLVVQSSSQAKPATKLWFGEVSEVAVCVCKSCPRIQALSRESDLQEWPTRVSQRVKECLKIAPRECPRRVPHKLSQECSTIGLCQRRVRDQSVPCIMMIESKGEASQERRSAFAPTFFLSAVTQPPFARLYSQVGLLALLFSKQSVHTTGFWRHAPGDWIWSSVVL